MRVYNVLLGKSLTLTDINVLTHIDKALIQEIVLMLQVFGLVKCRSQGLRKVYVRLDKKEFDIDEVGFVVVRTLKGHISLSDDLANPLKNLNDDIRGAVADYNSQKKFTIVKKISTGVDKR